MTFDRDHVSTDFLAISRIIRELHYKKYNYDKGSPERTQIDLSIEALELLKKLLSDKIDNRSN